VAWTTFGVFTVLCSIVLGVTFGCNGVTSASIGGYICLYLGLCLVVWGLLSLVLGVRLASIGVALASIGGFFWLY